MKQKNDDLYRGLQKHLDKMPVGFPATETGIEIKLLQHLFASEQVQIALQLKFIGEPVKNIYRRLKKKGFSASKEELEKNEDGKNFHVTTASCLGCCTVAPAVEIDGKLHDKDSAKSTIIKLKGEK